MPTNAPASKVFRKEVLALSAYHVADAAGLIKLDAMENPYTWPEDLKQLWLNELKDCELNRYPDPEAKQLTQKIREQYNIPSSQELLLGNGSDEIIQMLLMALPPSASVLSVQPSFVMYKQIAQTLGLKFVEVPLQAHDFALDLPAMLNAIEQHKPAVTFLAYPNNPTGNLFDAEIIRQIIQAAPGLVIIDEAYEPFANASFLAEINQHENLLVMRTFSKLGLAGLRLGYMIGHPSIIEEINKVRLPYNINVLTQASVFFALSHHDVFEEQTQQICSERAVVYQKLRNISGIQPFPSAANFILFKTQNNNAAEVFSSLKQHGVLIKNLASQGGLLSDCLRVTIGKAEENATFLQVLIQAM